MWGSPSVSLANHTNNEAAMRLPQVELPLHSDHKHTLQHQVSVLLEPLSFRNPPLLSIQKASLSCFPISEWFIQSSYNLRHQEKKGLQPMGLICVSLDGESYPKMNLQQA